jgi:hypothetical protein
VAVTTAFILAVSGCASEPGGFEETDYTAVCVNQETNTRVDDDQCPQDQQNSSSSNLLLWYFIYRSVSAPAVGHPVSGGSYVRPATSSVGFAPKTGGFGTRVGAGS